LSDSNKKSKEYKRNLKLNQNLKEIMVGLLLGDGNMQTFSSSGTTWRLRLLQGGDNHFEYIKHLRLLFDDWTVMDLAENHEKNKLGQLYKKWYFNTLSFEQFAEIGNGFYRLDIESNKRKKILPILLKDWITELSLAYWFMDDGSYKWKDKILAIRFCTDNFSELEIDILISIMKDKFDLDVSKTVNKNNKWRLYVGTKNYDKIKEIIYPHLIPSMRYKFPK